MKFALQKKPVFIAMSLASILLIICLSYAFATGTNFFLTIKLFTQVLDLVKRYHVDPVDEGALVKAAIDGILSRLDPYSALLVGADVQQWEQELDEGNGSSISDVSMIQGEIGYVKIHTFSATTGEEFKTNILRLRELGMKKLLIDLRGNSGGYLRAAVAVCDQLLPSEKKIVTVAGRLPGFDQIYFSTSKENIVLYPIIILIDSLTASAAEIVAGAMQDWDRALIMGYPSAGKGLVQNQFQLSDSLVLLLSTARYFTPSGRSVQRNYNSVTQNYHNDTWSSFPDSATKISSPSPPSFFTASGRPVPDNEGIIPDVCLTSYSKKLDSLAHFASFDQISSVMIVSNGADATARNIRSRKSTLHNDTPLLIAIHYFDQAQLLLFNKSWADFKLQRP